MLLVPSQRRKRTRDVTHFSTLVFNDKITIKRHSGKSTFLLGRIKIICLPTSLSSQNTHEVGGRERPLLPASTLLDRCIAVQAPVICHPTEIIVKFYVPSDTVLFPKASEQAGGQMKEQLGMCACAPKDLWVSTTVAPQAPTIFLWLL